MALRVPGIGSGPSLLWSPTIRRYVVAVLLVGSGLFFSVLAFDQPASGGWSRMGMAAPAAASGIPGTVQPSGQTTVTADTPVRIEDVLVEPGQTVSAGQTLFIVDDRDARQAIDQARLDVEDAATQVRILELTLGDAGDRVTVLSDTFAEQTGAVDIAAREAAAVPTPQSRLSTARAEAASELAALKLTRMQALFAEGVVSRQDVDDARVAARIAADDLASARQAEAAMTTLAQAETKRAAARRALSAAQQRHDRLAQVAELARARVRHERALVTLRALESRIAGTHIVAPAAGTVADVRVGKGDVVPAGALLARLADLTQLTVDLQVPSEEVARLKIGGRATIALADHAQRDGTIHAIEPLPGPAGTHHVVARFMNPSGRMLVGQTATVTFVN